MKCFYLAYFLLTVKNRSKRMQKKKQKSIQVIIKLLISEVKKEDASKNS
jgi:hypothetical protein